MNYFQLLKSLHDVYDRLNGKQVSKNRIIQEIRHAVPFRECVIFGIESLSIPKSMHNVAGLYDPARDEKGKPPIEIEIALPKRSNGFKFTEDDMSREHWAELCIDLAGILGHEFVHLQQFRSRDFDIRKGYRSQHKNKKMVECQEYYGDPDEIEAYAFNAAAKMIIDSIYLSKKANMLQKTDYYKLYAKIFKKNDPVVVKFSRLSNKYYKTLEQQYHATTF